MLLQTTDVMEARTFLRCVHPETGRKASCRISVNLRGSSYLLRNGDDVFRGWFPHRTAHKLWNPCPVHKGRNRDVTCRRYLQCRPVPALNESQDVLSEDPVQYYAHHWNHRRVLQIQRWQAAFPNKDLRMEYRVLLHAGLLWSFHRCRGHQSRQVLIYRIHHEGVHQHFLHLSLQMESIWSLHCFCAQVRHAWELLQHWYMHRAEKCICRREQQ